MGGVHRWGRHLIKKFRCDTIGDVHDSITYRLVVDLLVRPSLLLSTSTRDFYSRKGPVISSEWYQRASFALWRTFASLIQRFEDRRKSPRKVQNPTRGRRERADGRQDRQASVKDDNPGET